MKTKHILFLGVVIAFSSCSTAYRSGQTPDDVYFSPAPPQGTYVRTDNQDERESYAYNNNTTNREDMEIRRGIRNSRYRDNNVIVQLGIGGYVPYSYDPFGYNPYGLNSYGFNSYRYDPYISHGYGNGYNSLYYNPYNVYNNSLFVSPFNNYYYSPQVYVYPRTTGVRTTVAPRRYNLGAYNNSVNTVRNNNNYDRPANTRSSSPVRTFTTREQNNGSGTGNLIRRVFSSDNSNSTNRSNSRSYQSDNNNGSNTRSFRNDNNTNSHPERSTPSSSNSSSSGNSSAPVRTFKR